MLSAGFSLQCLRRVFSFLFGRVVYRAVRFLTCAVIRFGCIRGLGPLGGIHIYTSGTRAQAHTTVEIACGRHRKLHACRRTDAPLRQLI
jgi:hypothetical protein